ncbi:MAG: hypothetical protein WAV07_04305 [Candidatus Contendobacter sp.]
MTTLVEKLDRALYPTYARNWDDQLFRERILQRLTPKQSFSTSARARASSSR